KKRPGREIAPARKTPPPPSDPILDPLNDAQREAVLHEGGHLLVVAGPGTGKTLTLTHRMASLIRSGRGAPEQILGLTFTRKAAREMEERIVSLLQGHAAAIPHITTFHGFCLEILREEGHRIGMSSPFSICPEPDRDAIIREIFSKTEGRKINFRTFLNHLPALKRATLADEEESTPGSAVVTAFRMYQEKLRGLGMLDLDDLEVEASRLLDNHPGVAEKYALMYPHLFVDEYQDTNRIQVAILKALVRVGGARIFAIGDPDQAIYAFRGADLQNFFRFSDDFPGAATIHLEQNYRSGRRLLEGAAFLMEKEKPLEAVAKEPGNISIASCRSEKEEAEMVVAAIERLLGGTTYFSLDSGRVASHEDGMSLSFCDIGVLYRLNTQGDALEEALSRAGIPLVRSGETPLIQKRPVRLICSFLQMVQYPGTDSYRKNYARMVEEMNMQVPLFPESFPGTGTVPDLIRKCMGIHGIETASGEDGESLRRLLAWAEVFDDDLPAFLDALVLERGIDHGGLEGDRVGLMSLHAAKGLEWPVVFITGCEDRLIPCSLFGDHDNAEERRLFYVGMTRARSRLILSHARRRALNGRVLEMAPSPFLEAFPPSLCRPLDRGTWKPKARPHHQLNLF
ncbi:MAG: ATP-dependent helicase, partial [Deltaproteobacteria bacterium]|nr:ATP-dependent helicase [Deltaproteobacteria bacterium]